MLVLISSLQQAEECFRFIRDFKSKFDKGLEPNKLGNPLKGNKSRYRYYETSSRARNATLAKNEAERMSIINTWEELENLLRYREDANEEVQDVEDSSVEGEEDSPTIYNHAAGKRKIIDI